MKRENPQKRPTRTEKTPSNNENNKKQTTLIEEENKQLLSPKASAGERQECHATETASFQESR